jgi:hypothetical protein
MTAETRDCSAKHFQRLGIAFPPSFPEALGLSLCGRISACNSFLPTDNQLGPAAIVCGMRSQDRGGLGRLSE